MAVSFPASPLLNDTYTVGTKTWIWNGYAWDIVVASVAPAFDKANSANVLAYNTGIGANAYASAVGTSTNAYASSVGTSTNAYSVATFSTITNTAAAFGRSNLTYNATNSVFGVANAAYGRANTSAQLAYGTVVAGGTTLSAASNNDTLTISSSNNIVLIPNASNDSVQITQAPSGVTASTYGGATSIPTFVIDAYGRITSAANVAVSAGGLTVGLEASNTSAFYPIFTSNTSGSISSANVDSAELYYTPSSGTLSAKVFNSLSDVTLKTDIEEINGIKLLNKVNPVSFRWKSNGIKSYGVIAQELEQVLPELVQTNEGVKSVSYIPLVAMLIDVVKKQQIELEEIKTRLNMENKR